METLTLVIGSKAYSSWSLRAWLALKMTGASFTETLVPLRRPDSRAAILAHSPSGKVPLLRHGELRIGESLAICEYLAELSPGARLWPAEREARAVARAISAEMHAGFAALRTHMSMDLHRDFPGQGRGPGVDSDVARIVEIWESSRQRFGGGGPFLFGHFTVADAMFAPVVTRFRTYAVSLPAGCQAYANAVWSLPAMQEWAAAAGAEPEAEATAPD